MIRPIKNFFYVLCMRAMAMGRAIPKEERWRVFMPAAAGLAGIALASAIVFFEPEIEQWRLLAGWSMIGMSAFCLFLGIGWIYGHYSVSANHSGLDEGALYSEGKSYMGIAFSAAIIVPPLVRVIFGPFE